MPDQLNQDTPTLDLAVAYEPDYVIEDVVLSEPFVVFRTVSGNGRNSWWQSRVKVETLIASFKMRMTIAQACVQAGITHQQYKYFCEVHPTFLEVKSRCKSFSSIIAKTGVMADLQIKGKDGIRARQWFLEHDEPETYGRDIGAYTPPPAGAAAKITGEAFLDDEGKVIVSKQTAEFLNKDHGDSQERAEGAT